VLEDDFRMTLTFDEWFWVKDRDTIKTWVRLGPYYCSDVIQV